MNDIKLTKPYIVIKCMHKDVNYAVLKRSKDGVSYKFAYMGIGTEEFILSDIGRDRILSVSESSGFQPIGFWLEQNAIDYVNGMNELEGFKYNGD